MIVRHRQNLWDKEKLKRNTTHIRLYHVVDLCGKEQESTSECWNSDKLETEWKYMRYWNNQRKNNNGTKSRTGRDSRRC